MTVRVRPVVHDDAAAWLRMRQALWPEDEDGWHAKEIEEFLAGRLKMPLAVLVAVDDADRADRIRRTVHPHLRRGLRDGSRGLSRRLVRRAGVPAAGCRPRADRGLRAVGPRSGLHRVRSDALIDNDHQRRRPRGARLRRDCADSLLQEESLNSPAVDAPFLRATSLDRWPLRVVGGLKTPVAPGEPRTARPGTQNRGPPVTALAPMKHLESPLGVAGRELAVYVRW